MTQHSALSKGGLRSVAVLGAGSLGCLYGAAFARAGLEVTLLCRPAHANAIKADGLRVEDATGGGSSTHEVINVRATSDPGELRPVDLVLVATKGHDIASTLASVPALASPISVLSIANGVRKDELLTAWSGPGPVLGAMSMVGGVMTGPGAVRYTNPGRTFVGALATSTSSAEHVADALESGGLSTTCSADIGAVEWTKLVHSVGAMAIATLSGLPLHAAYLDPDLSALYVSLVTEGVAVANAAGIDVRDVDDVFPVRTLADGEPVTSIRWVQDWGAAMAARGLDSIIISMLSDIQSGRRLELDDIHGWVRGEAVRLGLGAETPVLATVLALLRSAERRGLKI